MHCTIWRRDLILLVNKLLFFLVVVVLWRDKRLLPGRKVKQRLICIIRRSVQQRAQLSRRGPGHHGVRGGDHGAYGWARCICPGIAASAV